MQERRTRWVSALVASIALLLASAPTALASQSITNSYKCTITSKPPTLSGTTITTYAVINCTKSATITVDIKAVEMDSGNEQANVAMAENKALSVAVTAGVDKTVSTTGTCVNTETGYEEYATKARVGIGSKYSSYDRTSPANDSYNC